MGPAALAEVRRFVEGIKPLDRHEDEHRSQVLSWLSRTDDIFRRAKPRTPAQHLVSYFLVVDPDGPCFLLVHHIKAGKWLPPGGHVEPGEGPVDTVKREIREELGIQAQFPAWIGERPLFLTVTDTVGALPDRHTDVSLWFVLEGHRHQELVLDASEFHEARWWTADEVLTSDPMEFDPHMGRMLEKLTDRLRQPEVMA